MHAPWGGVLIAIAGFAQDPLPVKRMQVNGTDLAYVEQGADPPVVSETTACGPVGRG
jgi:hypothetical protein